VTVPHDAFNNCPDAGATFVYVVTEEFELMSFYPPTGAFTAIGTLDCPVATNGSGSPFTPFSMAVDKSGIAYVGDGVWVADRSIEAALRSQRGIEIRDLVVVPAAEAYAANCVRVNGAVLVAAGYPLVSGALERSGHRVISLEVSEFRKMDGGLSCLSLRF